MIFVGTRAVGAVVARFLDTEEVTGSNPVPPIVETPNVFTLGVYFLCQLLVREFVISTGDSLSTKCAHE